MLEDGAGLRPHLLPLERDVADHVQHDRAGDQADDLRPGLQDAFVQRQRRRNAALELREQGRHRLGIGIEQRHQRLAVERARR